MFRYISVIIILTVLGVLYEKYKLKFMPDEELEKYDLIRKYLLNGDEDLGGKPILWIHTTHEVNARNWQSFFSRNTTKLNQPYILSCLETIVKSCGESFNICLIDDNSFSKLLPKWEIQVRNLANPIRPHIRALAMANLLHSYGGMQIPDSTIVLKDLKPMYDKYLSNRCCFVGETLSRNITATDTSLFPNIKIIGCKKNSPVMSKYIGKLELLNSRDYTNEMDFLGEMARELYSYIISGQMNKISGCVFGAKDHYNNDVTIDRLLGNTFIDFSPKLCAIYLPSKEILTRTKFGWFSRLSQEQLKTCDTIATKWLVIAQNQKI
jgi:hypothetical protein